MGGKLFGLEFDVCDCIVVCHYESYLTSQCILAYEDFKLSPTVISVGRDQLVFWGRGGICQPPSYRQHHLLMTADYLRGFEEDKIKKKNLKWTKKKKEERNNKIVFWSGGRLVVTAMDDVLRLIADDQSHENPITIRQWGGGRQRALLFSSYIADYTASTAALLHPPPVDDLLCLPF